MLNRSVFMIKNTRNIWTINNNNVKHPDDNLKMASISGIAGTVYAFALYKDKDTVFSKDFQNTYNICKYLTGFTLCGSLVFLLKHLKK